jgi:hypothetical protein
MNDDALVADEAWAAWIGGEIEVGVRSSEGQHITLPCYAPATNAYVLKNHPTLEHYTSTHND